MYFQHDYHVQQTDDESREGVADDEDDGDDDDDKSSSTSLIPSSSDTVELYSKASSSSSAGGIVVLSQKSDEPVDSDSSSKLVNSNDKLIVDITDLDTCKYLQISTLNEWDYPIFEAASLHPNFVLSKVSWIILVCNCCLYL